LNEGPFSFYIEIIPPSLPLKQLFLVLLLPLAFRRSLPQRNCNLLIGTSSVAEMASA
jgi:hypothetical protein